MYERAYFPMKILNLSQGYGAGTSTHVYSYALDFCGKDSGRDDVYAPFDCKVTKRISSKDGLNIHKTMDFNKKSIIAEFKYNDDVILLRTKGDYALVYRMGILGWCSKKYLK